ncbi:MAG: hypothetical protein M3388_04490, partial [Acidobacteriota bacterium]|nr:hypothetical protein [Acidobacteriota bacterium]
MKKRLALISFIIFAIFSFAYRQTTESKRFDSSNEKSQRISEIKPQSVKAVAFGISEKVSSFAPASPEIGSTSKKMGRAEEQARAIPNKEPFRKQVEGAVHDSDSAQADFSDALMPAPSLSFDGLSNNDNAAAYGFRAVPPDTNGDVGPNHYVQSVNILTRVFDKSGNALTPPF